MYGKIYSSRSGFYKYYCDKMSKPGHPIKTGMVSPVNFRSTTKQGIKKEKA